MGRLRGGRRGGRCDAKALRSDPRSWHASDVRFCSCRAARPVCFCSVVLGGVFIVVEFGRWIPRVVELCTGIVVTVSCWALV
jgi:hypothetical protein